MLLLDIERIVRPKGLESVAVHLRNQGFSVKEARSLSHPHEKQLLRDTTVMRLCEALLCTPNDLFRWQGHPESHLNVLNSANVRSLEAVVAHLNQQELEQLVSKAQELVASLENTPTEGEGRLWLHVSHLITQRQQARPHSFLIGKGFTRSEASKLLDPNRKAFRVSMLTRLCLAFGCLPNDLFDWEGSENHHLNALRKSAPPDLKALLSQLPPEKVQEFLGQLRKKWN